MHCLLPSSSTHHASTRRGSALVVSSIVIITIAGLSIALTDLTIGSFDQQRHRQAQVDLLAATESAANETINWMRVNKTNPAVALALKNMPVSSIGYPTTTTSTSAVLVSSSMPSGLPALFPSLISSGGMAGANGTNLRNSCSVETKIIKVHSDGVPSPWDGDERFIAYITATAGDSSRPDTMRRVRVQTTIKSVSASVSTTTTTSVPTAAFPFTRGLFALNGFNITGNATTDSWISDTNNDGIAETPYVVPASYTPGGPNANGDIGSNGVLGGNAYDFTKVRGDATANAGATLPSVTYNPPTSGYTALASITNNATINGTGAGTTVYRVPSINQGNNKSLTITGTGTVVIYVDSVFKVGDVNFAPGSTAKLVIYQNDVSGAGCSFNSQNNVGDPNDPSRFLFVTAYSGTGASNEMKLNGGAKFSAVVLAPNAGIKFNGNSDFYGSFVARDFSGAVNGTFRFHYDESLAGKSWGTIMTDISTTSTTTDLSDFEIIAWDVKNLGYGTP